MTTEEIKKKKKQYRENHRAERRAYNKAWREKNKARFLDYRRAWAFKTGRRDTPHKKNSFNQNNNGQIELFGIATRRHIKRKYLSRNPKHRLCTVFSGYLRSTLKNRGASKKKIHWEHIVGYTKKELILHLERNFKPGMTWENRSKWHIDHIFPLAKWDFDNVNHPEFKAAWALCNLRPLWGKENYLKKDRLPTIGELQSVKL
jgi:hypothetical protein